MGDSRHNPNALLKRAMPPSPTGIAMQAQIVAQKVVRHDLLVVPADKIREQDGRTEIFGNAPKRDDKGGLLTGADGSLVFEEEPTWHTPPAGYTVKAVGEQLSDDDFEVAHVLVNLVEHRTVVSANGRPVITAVELMEVGPRLPWKQLLQAHQAQKGGAGAVNGAERH